MRLTASGGGGAPPTQVPSAPNVGGPVVSHRPVQISRNTYPSVPAVSLLRPVQKTLQFREETFELMKVFQTQV
jgi:hypothetical protein